MPQWPIRVKLFIGLSLVVGMMLTMMGGSIFGLHAFHISNLTLMNQLRELGASTELLKSVMLLDQADASALDARPGVLNAFQSRVEAVREPLSQYHALLATNSVRGDRVDDGRDEFSLVFLIDDDLTAILRQLDPSREAEHLFDRTDVYLSRHPEAGLALTGPWDSRAILRARLERLSESAAELPDKLHRDFLRVLEISKGRYQSSRVIVWIAALAVIAMLAGLAILFHRWVLYPVRLLQRGVRRVARGQFDYHIDLHTGDEMQDLAEAFNDMTTRLSATYADLERQIHERSRQLVRSERLASVGFLAAGVAHEINNPLAAIAFSSEAMEGRLRKLFEGESPSPETKVLQNYLQMIQQEAFRCKGITEKLLDFSRCNDIRRQRNDLVELVQSVVEMIRHMGKYRNKQILFQPREAVFAHVDPQEIKQVVLNLVVNALDCMEPGGTLRIEVRNQDGMAEMRFLDDGCGMSPELMENIFEPFFTRRKVGKGTGLGLSITHRIVSQHHGEINAASPGDGLGSTFTVRLPVRAQEPHSDRQVGSRSEPEETHLKSGSEGVTAIPSIAEHRAAAQPGEARSCA